MTTLSSSTASTTRWRSVVIVHPNARRRLVERAIRYRGCPSVPSIPRSTSSRSRIASSPAGVRRTSPGRSRSSARTASRGSSTRARRRPTAAPGSTTCGPACSRTSTPASRPCGAGAVPRKGGWDCHGLPVELEIEKELGLHSKHEIEAYGIAEFNQRCRESVRRYVEDWAALTSRSGTWIDTKDAYWTLSNDYIESVWWLVRQMWDAGPDLRGAPRGALLRRAVAPLSRRTRWRRATATWSTRRCTCASRSPTAPRRWTGADLLVWTTTPWTLVSNVGAAVGPHITYVRVLDPAGGADLVMASAARERRYPEAEVVASLTGCRAGRCPVPAPDRGAADRRDGPAGGGGRVRQHRRRLGDRPHRTRLR